MRYEIDRLNNHTDIIPELAILWHQALEAYSSVKFTQTELEKALHDIVTNDALPTVFVAIVEGKPVGMCSLHLNYGVRIELAPWLSDLVVHPTYQKQGIAKALIAGVQDYSIQLKYEALHLFIFEGASPKFYTQMGWEIFGHDEYGGRPIILLRLKFTK